MKKRRLEESSFNKDTMDKKLFCKCLSHFVLVFTLVLAHTPLHLANATDYYVQQTELLESKSTDNSDFTEF